MTPPITFAINTRKAVEALVWIIQRGKGGMDLYTAMKIVFAADKYHLNTYGCPIAGDRYVAMNYGTVPYWTYNAAKNPKEDIWLPPLRTRAPFDAWAEVHPRHVFRLRP